MSEPLADLRDIHLPDPVSWWPPAPGWWWLLGAVLLLLALVVAVILYRRRTRWRREALAELQRLEREQLSDLELLQGLSTLLRRIALSRQPRAQVAALSGEAWRDYLRDGPKGPSPLADYADLFIDAPYRPEVSIERARLLQQVRRWIKALPLGTLQGGAA